jgi:tetratricopeptide (TPR) repeat protein
MNRIWAICLLGLWAWPVVARADDDLTAARRLLHTGKYAEAREIYARTKTPAAVLGLARSQAAEGKLDETVQTLVASAGEHADLHAELALLAFDRGDYPAATGYVETSLRFNTQQLLARWIQGELFRVTGKLDEAAKAYRWLVEYYNDHEVKSAESLRWIGLAAAQYARWNRLSDQFQFLVTELYPDALKLEPDFWPAHLEAGLLFLEKYNQEDAAYHLKAALALNPNAAEIHAALAQLALVGHEPDQAEASAKRALEINPRLREAWLVKAELAWANFRPEEAAGILQKHALKLNPVCEEALGRLAACYAILDGRSENRPSKRFTQLVERATARNPHAGDFFLALALWFDDRNQFTEAEQFFREASQRMPQLLGPKNHLGMMLMRVGREADARKLLEAGFKEDPFNVRVKNTLELLDVLDSFTTVETGNCLLRFDAQHDKLLGRYAARYLAEIYPKLCEQFGYRPTDRPLVEVFGEARGSSGHQWFSTRMVGLPYLGTVAASTGKIVAMVSPAAARQKAKFNWAQVLTHEMVHVITLQQTHFNIPHWYTEGLAVWSEGYPRASEWNELLIKRVNSGKLFNLDTLNFGFSRPKSGDDWLLAYYQADLYVEYMLEGRTPEVLRKLLAAYAENLSTPEAIERVFGQSQQKFEEGYVAYLKKTVARLSGGQTPAETNFTAILKAYEAKPQEADRAAELAYAYQRRGSYPKALELAEQVLAKEPKHPLAAYVLARIQARAGQTEEALKLLEKCLDPQKPDPKLLNLLASLKLKAEDYAEAARLYELGAKLQPHDMRWLRALALVYARTENRAKLAEVFTQIARGDPDHLTSRIELARMALQKREYETAIEWANQALQIDVTEATAHQLLAEAAADRHNNSLAIEEYETAVELDPTAPQPQLALADVYLQVKKPEEARRVLEALLKQTPDHAVAKQLLETLKENGKRDGR